MTIETISHEQIQHGTVEQHILATYPDMVAYNLGLHDTLRIPTSTVGRAWHVPLGQWEKFRRLSIQPVDSLAVSEQMFLRKLSAVDGFSGLFKNIAHIDVVNLEIALDSGLANRLRSVGPKTEDFLRKFAAYTTKNAQNTIEK